MILSILHIFTFSMDSFFFFTNITKDMTAMLHAEMTAGFTASVFAEASKISSNKFMQTMNGSASTDLSSTKAIQDENEMDTKLRLQKENPKLPRPFVLRAASGRYSTEMPVDQDMEVSHYRSVIIIFLLLSSSFFFFQDVRDVLLTLFKI